MIYQILIAALTQALYLNYGPISYTPPKLIIAAGCERANELPRASNTCPDLSEPSGNVKDTISLYLGNFTYIMRFRFSCKIS